MSEPTVWSVLRQRWRDTRSRKAFPASLREIAADFWEFLKESTPERKRRRYGDVEYDWDHDADTTSATVSHRGRLLAALAGAPYQPSEPAIFREMIQAVDSDLRDFTFIDLGSGKGRTLLLAAEFPFRRIVGVELVPELHHVAQRNIAAIPEEIRKGRDIELICADARAYVFPPEPIFLYLFNPLPAAAVQQVIENLRRSLENHPRPVRVVYNHPTWEQVLTDAPFLRKIGGKFQYSIYSN